MTAYKADVKFRDRFLPWLGMHYLQIACEKIVKQKVENEIQTIRTWSAQQTLRGWSFFCVLYVRSEIPMKF